MKSSNFNPHSLKAQIDEVFSNFNMDRENEVHQESLGTNLKDEKLKF